MAQLTSEQRDELSAELQRFFSSIWAQIDITKVQLDAAIDVFDAGMETAETTILGNVSAAARAWLIANQTLARYILEEVAEKRREVL